MCSESSVRRRSDGPWFGVAHLRSQAMESSWAQERTKSLHVAVILECCTRVSAPTRSAFPRWFSNRSALAVRLYAFVGCNACFARLVSVRSTRCCASLRRGPNGTKVFPNSLGPRDSAQFEATGIWSRHNEPPRKMSNARLLQNGPLPCADGTPPNILMGCPPGSKTLV
jgi:hypothetical protein